MLTSPMEKRVKMGRIHKGLRTMRLFFMDFICKIANLKKSPIVLCSVNLSIEQQYIGVLRMF